MRRLVEKHGTLDLEGPDRCSVIWAAQDVRIMALSLAAMKNSWSWIAASGQMKFRRVPPGIIDPNGTCSAL